MSDHAGAYRNAGSSAPNFGSWWDRCKFKILFVLLVAVITGARKRIYTSQCLFLSSSDAPGRPMYMTIRTRTRYAVEGALSVSGSGNQNFGLCDIFSNDSRLRKSNLSGGVPCSSGNWYLDTNLSLAGAGARFVGHALACSG